MVGNGEISSGGLTPHDVAAAVAEAIAEHEGWLRAWQRAMACGLPPGEAVLAEGAHRTCGFGRWLARLGDEVRQDVLLCELDRVHRAMHEAARAASRTQRPGGGMTAVEYDAAMDAVDAFRGMARRVREACAVPPEASGTPEDDALSELQGRLTMLSELERERDRALRTDIPLSLMAVLPEGMHEVEQAHGQGGLDRVIAGFATRLFGLLRPYDGIYRHGRTDFVVCLPGTTAEQAGGVARRLLEVVTAAPVVLPDDTELTLRAGFGIAAVDSRSPVQETLEHAVRAAAMAAERMGDRVVVWTPGCEN